MGTVEAALELTEGGGPVSAEGSGAGFAGFERVVALKRLLPEAARDTRRTEMFLREARLAAMLDHPNVVRAYDYGKIDGELFLAMEYVEGQSLSRVLRALADEKAELGASLTAHVLADVCEGLHAAHELHDENGQALSLVHRDVSPQNVMVGYDGHVRLLDFGVAKIDTESVTKTGEVKGKTAYMSPEQAMGDPIDRRSDLFGVGAVLFECLALRRMWGDGTDMDVIRKLALEEPPRLDDAVLDASPALCAIYTRLVARRASDRPGTAHDVAQELRALVPQGREAAARALRELLDDHFGEQAEEQRHLLTTALEQVAPAQARDLRESVRPAAQAQAEGQAQAEAPGLLRRVSAVALAAATGDARGAATEDRRRRESAATLAAATGDERGAATTSRKRAWAGLALAALVGGLVWRVVSSSDPVAGAGAGAAGAGAAGSGAAGSSLAAAAPSAAGEKNEDAKEDASAGASTEEKKANASAEDANAGAGAGTGASLEEKKKANANASAEDAGTGTGAPPSAGARGSTRAPAAAPPSSASERRPPPAPVVTAKAPPDVDDHPF